MARRTIQLLCTSLLAIALHLLTAPAADAAYLDCLERAEGKTLSWDGRWVRSTADQNVDYRITSVQIKNVMPHRSVTLELSALSRASESKRSITAETEEKARVICERIRVEQAPLRFPGQFGDPFRTTTSDPLTMPFIKYTQDGWVRAKIPANLSKLAICRVHDREFSCLEEEKSRFGVMLRNVEEEIRWSGQ